MFVSFILLWAYFETYDDTYSILKSLDYNGPLVFRGTLFIIPIFCFEAAVYDSVAFLFRNINPE